LVSGHLEYLEPDKRHIRVDLRETSCDIGR